MSLYEYCVTHGMQDLLRQWHPVKNAGRTPAGITPGSHYRAWWICDKGHVWQAQVNSRATGGTGCPVCSNRRLIPGGNDLAATHPALARQWHPEKNGALTPHDVVSGARRKVWWRCDRGHEWQASIASRARNNADCPVCAGKAVIPGENDLATHFPEITAQWRPTYNGNLTAQSVTPYSNKKVWWECPAGHAYTAAVATRTARLSGCPYCTGRKVLAGFNDLATVKPRLAEQWHSTLNGSLTPQMVTAGSHRKVWWACPAGHAWKAVIYSRAGAQGCGCPVCAGKARSGRAERYAPMRESPGNSTADAVFHIDLSQKE